MSHTKDLDVSILVNNAGVPGTDKLQNLSKELLEQMMFVNAAAPMFLMREFVERFMERSP